KAKRRGSRVAGGDLRSGMGSGGIYQQGNGSGFWQEFANNLEPLLSERRADQRHPRGVAARPIEAGDKSSAGGIETHNKYNRNFGCCGLGCKRRRWSLCQEDGYPTIDELSRHSG